MAGVGCTVGVGELDAVGLADIDDVGETCANTVGEAVVAGLSAGPGETLGDPAAVVLGGVEVDPTTKKRAQAIASASSAITITATIRRVFILMQLFYKYRVTDASPSDSGMRPARLKRGAVSVLTVRWPYGISAIHEAGARAAK